MSLENELRQMIAEKDKWHKLELYFKVTDEAVFINEIVIRKEEEE